MIIVLVYKGVINEVGIFFFGYIEFFVDFIYIVQVVMMLVICGLCVVLVIIYLLLCEVVDVISDECLFWVVCIFYVDLCDKFGIVYLCILVCGFNLYVGEGGYLGWEEIEVIEFCFECLCGEGFDLVGLLLVDILFIFKYLEYCDVVLVMYYDQGFFVFKYKGFGVVVNVIFGLLIICIFVDYGIVFDLVGSGCIDSGSLQVVLEIVYQMVVSCC